MRIYTMRILVIQYSTDLFYLQSISISYIVRAVTGGYIELTVQSALELKFERGATKHRDNPSEFHGDPLEELFQECLDAMHYCDWIEKQYGIDLSHRRSQFHATALEVQTHYRQLNAK